MNVKQLEELLEALERPLITPNVSYKFVKKDNYNWYMYICSNNGHAPLDSEIDRMLFGLTNQEALSIERSKVQGSTRLEFNLSRERLRRLSYKLFDTTLVSSLIRWGNSHAWC